MAIHKMFENEDSLLAALKKGDNKAFKHLYHVAYGKVENFILTNSGRKEDAKDIFQESIIVVLRKIKEPDFKLTSKISTYVYSINRNLWLKYIRDKMGREVNIIDDEDSPFVLIEDDNATPEIDAKHEVIRAELETTGEPCKTVIMAAYFQKLPHEEIAKILGYTKDFVRIKLFRCMAKLRQAVKQKLDKKD